MGYLYVSVGTQCRDATVAQTLSTAAELRRPVYRAVALRSVSVDGCLQQMTTVKWDIKDIMSQHSGYVDSLLRVSIAD